MGRIWPVELESAATCSKAPSGTDSIKAPDTYLGDCSHLEKAVSVVTECGLCRVNAKCFQSFFAQGAPTCLYLADSHVFQTASMSLCSGRQPHPQSESVTFSEYSPGTLYTLHRGTDSHTLRIACLLLCTARQALSTKWAGRALLLCPCTPSRWHRVGSAGR